jgi:tetratricopeptide (TPR) repeat protein
MSPADAFPAAKAAATKALALDDNLGEAHASLAFVLDLYDWNWDAAEKEYERAIALDPSYATAHQWYAWHLIETGRYSEGIGELKKAASLDPLSLIVGADLADALSIDHRFDASIEQSRMTLDLAPDFAIAHYELAQAFEQKGMHREAIVEFQKAIALSGHSGTLDSNLAYVYAVTGRTDEARKIASDLESRHDRDSSINANIALIYVGLHDYDQAMSWLNKAYDARFNPSILLRPAFDGLRSDARFQELANRIGLSQLARPVE